MHIYLLYNYKKTGVNKTKLYFYLLHSTTQPLSKTQMGNNCVQVNGFD